MADDNIDELRQLLNCPVCLEDFTGDTETNLLPCLHSLCESCLPKMIKDGVLSCPICRTEHSSGCFTTDSTTRDLADYVVVKKAENINCEGKGCEDISVASHRCLPCGEFLCDDCISAHRRTTLTKDHKLKAIGELRDATDLNMFSHPQTCQIHPGKPLELYCNRQQCQTPVCVTCAFVNHRIKDGHDLVDINDVARQRRIEISTMISKLKQKMESVTEATEGIAGERKEIKLREEYVNSEIDAVIDTLRQQLDRTRENLKDKVAKQVKRKCENLDQQTAGLNGLQSNMERAVLYFDKVVLHSSVPAFLQLDKTVSDRLECLLLEPFDKEPWEMAAFGLERQGVSGEVQNVLTKKMDIWSSLIYPPNSKISQQKEVSAGEEAVFHIDMKTSEGQPVTENAHFQAVMIDPRGDTLPVQVNENGQHNGKFVVRYTPMIEGVYSLELSIQNRTFTKHSFTVGNSGLETDGGEQTEEKKVIAEKQHVIPPFPQQVVSNYPDIFDTTHGFRAITFYLDKDTAHKEVTVSEDGTTFSNTQQVVLPKMSVQRPNRHKKFKGARGTHVFSKPGRYFYEVILEMQIVASLEKNNIAFEIGIARKGSIDNKKYIEGQPYAWSMIGAQHPSCDSICIHVVRERKVLLHKKLVKNDVGEQCRIVLGFLLDTTEGLWVIYNSEDGEKLCVVENVNCDEPLFPVISGYNSTQIQVTADFVTGHENPPNQE